MLSFSPTADGSLTLFNSDIGEHYHSKHGALQESKHVFVDAGLEFVLKEKANEPIHLLEVGFGTGLNFLLTCQAMEQSKSQLFYVGIEAFPLSLAMLTKTGYKQFVDTQTWDSFIQHYSNTFQQSTALSSNCNLQIAHQTLQAFTSEPVFDLIYFDAFSVRHQPELWSAEMIAKVTRFMKQGAVLVTYAITGNLKRALIAGGCTIEKLPGAAGKREMLRAQKK